MVVTCNDCGKTHKFDTSKLNGKVASSMCGFCGNILRINPAEDTKGCKRGTVGLRAKKFALFFVFPVALIITAGYLF